MNGMNLMYRLQHKVLPLVIAGIIGLLPALAGIHPSQVIGESMAPTLRDHSIHLVEAPKRRYCDAADCRV